MISIFPRNCPSIHKCSYVERWQNLGLKRAITNAKVNVEIFDGQNIFGLWHSDIEDVLYMLDLDIVLK